VNFHPVSAASTCRDGWVDAANDGVIPHDTRAAQIAIIRKMIVFKQSLFRFFLS
jgi:hypothetical protein